MKSYQRSSLTSLVLFLLVGFCTQDSAFAFEKIPGGNYAQYRGGETATENASTPSTSLGAPQSRFFPKPDLAIPDPAPAEPTPPKEPVMGFKFMPIRQIYRFVKVRLLTIVMLYGLFIVNTLFSFFFVIIKFWMREISLKRFNGYVMAHKLTPLTELKFDFGRMLTYFPLLIKSKINLFTLRANMRSADELVGEQTIPSDDVFLSQVLLRSPISFYGKNEATKYIVDLSATDAVVKYPHTCYDVEKIEVDKKTSEIIIHTFSAGPISNLKNSREEFDKAKVFACQTILFYISAIGHSWVHFYLPDVVAATVHNKLKRNTLLYRLMERHTRYTCRINWEALGVRGPLVFGDSALVRMAAEASCSQPRGSVTSPAIINQFNKMMEPWTPFSISASEFAKCNSKRTTEYYLGEKEEFACPPKWLREENNPELEIPYIKSLKRLYPIIRDHVEKVLSYEDPAIVDGFIAEIDKASAKDGVGGLNLLERFDRIDIIASIIFDVMIVHSTDHWFIYNNFRTHRMGLGTMRHTFKETWYPDTRVPDDLVDDDDRVRALNFLDVFVQFKDSKLFPNRLEKLNYGFKVPALRNAGEDLINMIKAEHAKMRTEGDCFCPMERISRSICF